MPDVLVIIAMFVLVFTAFGLFVGEEIIAGIVLSVLFGICVLWFSLAHIECGNKIKGQELLPIHNIQTNSGVVQVAFTGDVEFINVVGKFHKLVDAERCQVKQTTYNNLNYGMFCMTCSERSYSLECRP